jgi:hypothetical protein
MEEWRIKETKPAEARYLVKKKTSLEELWKEKNLPTMCQTRSQNLSIEKAYSA